MHLYHGHDGVTLFLQVPIIYMYTNLVFTIIQYGERSILRVHINSFSQTLASILYFILLCLMFWLPVTVLCSYN